MYLRCLAPHDDLDGMGGYCSRRHREEVLENHGLTDLWDMFGIVGNVTIGLLLYCCLTSCS
jgi:hypothetical protein